MPITVTAAQGALTPAGEKEVLPRLSATLLKWHGLTGNTFMTPIVVGSLHLLPPAHLFAGGRNQSVAFIELKVPSVTFGSPEISRGFVAEATAILVELSGGHLSKETVFVNVTHTVDGTWGLVGQAYSNAELGELIGRGMPTAAPVVS